MRITIETKVPLNPDKVWQGFNRELFVQLSPTFPKVNLLRFDGCKVGDEVHLELIFPFFKQSWHSTIIESAKTDSGYYFIDRGTVLPFFLSSWKHTHKIERRENETYITDAIDFKAYNFILECLVYPGLWVSFMKRKPIYKRIFNPKS